MGRRGMFTDQRKTKGAMRGSVEYAEDGSCSRNRPVPESPPEFPLEDYIGYLTALARVLCSGGAGLRNKLEVEDLVQETLERAHTAASQFRGTTPEEYSAWLRKVFASVAADEVRRLKAQKRDVRLEETLIQTIDSTDRNMNDIPTGGQTSPSSYVGRHEYELRLADALNALPADQQTAIVLNKLLGYTLSEVATYMARTKPSVAGLLRRALATLAEQLKEYP